ncbi:peptidase M19 [Litorivivens sp.]|uniref:peptidase M19 n=1 Tax=Litorivivens sp. TaxID=2020868 RepID=UPI0035699B69
MIQRFLLKNALSITLRTSISLLLLAGLSACNDDSSSSSNSVPAPAPVSPLGKYDLYNQCWVMKVGSDYVVRDGETFVANGTSAGSAEKFYMRAANLARYLFYTSDEMLMTASGSDVSTVPLLEAEDGSDWTFTESGDVLNAATLGGSLAVGANGLLVLGDTPAPLTFEAAFGCAEYPEMPLGVIGQSYTGNVNEPVLGFAEVHAHMSMGSEMSDGSRNVGPSAGGVQWGQAVHRFGVPHALGNCESFHGPDGMTDPEALILDSSPGTTHDTEGWPTFIDWPKNDSQLHQQMYWRWVERAWMSGLRLMTVLGTNIEALCQVAQNTGPSRGQNPLDLDCVDMSVGMKQVEYLSDMQDYIDAQFGGPGKGFFRIVGSPAEARQVIAEGKLAVIPGLEFTNIWGCNVRFLPGDNEISSCTKEDIDAEIDRVWDAGVRQVFPFHDVDSSLGGAGLFSDILELVNFYGTGRFFETYACEDGGEGENFLYNAGLKYLATREPQDDSVPIPQPILDPVLSNLGDDPNIALLLEATNGMVPTMESGRRCNARTVTDLGIYAIDKMMKKGFIIDIDHAEIKSKQIMLDHTAKTEPDYPLVSGHGGQGGINNEQAKQIILQGGVIYPGNKNGFDHVKFLEQLKPLWDASGTTREFSVGYGADANGLRDLPGPRGMGRVKETGAVPYPFRLFSGDDWGPQFDNTAPLLFEMLSVPSDNGRLWDVNEGGMYHYGMIPDLVEEIRLEGGKEALDSFYNSAETYLQMWEQTLEAAAHARTLPVPQTVQQLESH